MPAQEVAEGTLLWRPSEALRSSCQMTAFMAHAETVSGHSFSDYDALWQWSVDEPGAFWSALAGFYDVSFHAPPTCALEASIMPGTRWFPGATLNHAEHLLRRRDDTLAVIARDESGAEQRLTYAELYALAARVADGLRNLGVKRGDRVAAFVSNLPEALAAFLGAASLGAIWSSCAPEFGVSTVLDRFSQIQPKVLFAVGGYTYGGRRFDRSAAVAEIQAGLPSLEQTVLVDGPSWEAFLGDATEIDFEPVPFDHPLWVLYSSGTTGLPKAIVQGHGGILLEHLKAVGLHCNLGVGDRFFWYTTTGWMMWNFLVGGLLTGATLVLFDGHPMWPDGSQLWSMAADLDVTFFGVSAPYLMACRKAGMKPGFQHDLSALRGVGSTGAPLPAEGFAWVYEEVGSDLLLASVSGGTDVCTAFLLSCPLLPVHAGELQCMGLGCKIVAYDADAQSVEDELGELVLEVPLPSMPIYFWGDEDGARLMASYYDTFPGVWRHGDWIKVVSARRSFVVYGRSDSTLNRGGVRMGTSEFYRVVEGLEGVADSLVVDTGSLGREGRLWLFVVPAEGRTLDAELVQQLRRTLRSTVSPRHVPDELIEVSEVPYTLSGKKIEVPIKKILMGVDPKTAVSADSLRNPRALEPFLVRAGEAAD